MQQQYTTSYGKTHTIPTWVSNADSYHEYLEASDRCEAAFAPLRKQAGPQITLEAYKGRYGHVIGYWLHIDGKCIENPNSKSGTFKYEQTAYEYARNMINPAPAAPAAPKPAAPAAPRPGCASERQINYILRLLADRRRSGEAGGFFYGPTTRSGIAQLSRNEASTYIDSLTGSY